MIYKFNNYQHFVKDILYDIITDFLIEYPRSTNVEIHEHLGREYHKPLSIQLVYKVTRAMIEDGILYKEPNCTKFKYSVKHAMPSRPSVVITLK